MYQTHPDRNLCPYFWKANESKWKTSLHVVIEIYENFLNSPYNEVDFSFAGIFRLHLYWRNFCKIVN